MAKNAAGIRLIQRIRLRRRLRHSRESLASLRAQFSDIAL